MISSSMLSAELTFEPAAEFHSSHRPLPPRFVIGDHH